MTPLTSELFRYRDVLAALAWKSVALRYKQAYLGVLWVILKPMVLVLIFMLVRSFVGIDSGDIPYPLLTYCALLPWVFFQESASDGTGSVVNHATLIRKIYLPREIFPLAAVITKSVELLIGVLILLALMGWYGFPPRASMVWAPIVLVLAALPALTIALAGSAMNVYVRDVTQIVPLLLSLMMYASPIMYPLTLVKKKLLEEQAAGGWSDALYLVYTLNPLTGIIDSFQRVMLQGLGPDWQTLAPGLLLIAVALPASYLIFKRAESYFADVI